MSTRRTIPAEQKLEWGRAVHEGPISIRDGAKQFGLAESQLRTYVAMYCDANGLPISNPGSLRVGKRAAGKTNSAEHKKAADRERSRLRREQIKAAKQGAAVTHFNGNGTGKHLAIVASSDGDKAKVAQLQEQVMELAAELNAAHDELEVMRKILMVVGAKL